MFLQIPHPIQQCINEYLDTKSNRSLRTTCKELYFRLMSRVHYPSHIVYDNTPRVTDVNITVDTENDPDCLMISGTAKYDIYIDTDDIPNLMSNSNIDGDVYYYDGSGSDNSTIVSFNVDDFDGLRDRIKSLCIKNGVDYE